MKQITTAILALSVVALASTGARATEYITNGGFETGNFDGWTTGGNFEATGVSGNFAGYLPHSGNYFAYLGPVGSDGTLSQTFTDTAGTPLTVSFWLASNGTTPNDFSATFDADTLFSESNIPSQPYTEYSFTVTGTGSDTLTLAFRNDPNYLALDDVSVSTGVPEPATLSLLGLGVLAVGAARARRAR